MNQTLTNADTIKIKDLNKESNMNQQDFADKLDIQVTHSSKKENGHLLRSIDIVQRLMKVFLKVVSFMI
jgi:DNA-binding XRE family transcriptional regulator